MKHRSPGHLAATEPGVPNFGFPKGLGIFSRKFLLCKPFDVSVLVQLTAKLGSK